MSKIIHICDIYEYLINLINWLLTIFINRSVCYTEDGTGIHIYKMRRDNGSIKRRLEAYNMRKKKILIAAGGSFCWH